MPRTLKTKKITDAIETLPAGSDEIVFRNTGSNDITILPNGQTTPITLAAGERFNTERRPDGFSWDSFEINATGSECLILSIP